MKMYLHTSYPSLGVFSLIDPQPGSGRGLGDGRGHLPRSSGKGRVLPSGTFRTEAESSAEGRSEEGGAYFASGPVWLHLHL